jgi:hypothetical protein
MPTRSYSEPARLPDPVLRLATLLTHPDPRRRVFSGHDRPTLRDETGPAASDTCDYPFRPGSTRSNATIQHRSSPSDLPSSAMSMHLVATSRATTHRRTSTTPAHPTLDDKPVLRCSQQSPSTSQGHPLPSDKPTRDPDQPGPCDNPTPDESYQAAPRRRSNPVQLHPQRLPPPSPPSSVRHVPLIPSPPTHRDYPTPPVPGPVRSSLV